MYVHIPQQQASKNAKKLSEQLVEVVRAAKKNNKNLSYIDVYQATRLTSFKLREELGGMSQKVLLWIVVGFLFAIMVVGIVAAMGSSGWESSTSSSPPARRGWILAASRPPGARPWTWLCPRGRQSPCHGG